MMNLDMAIQTLRMVQSNPVANSAINLVLDELEKLRKPIKGNWRWEPQGNGRILRLFKGNQLVLIIDRTRLAINDMEGTSRLDVILGDGQFPNWEDQNEILGLLNKEHHCKDCCCARLWEVLGITESDGKDIVRHVRDLKTENNELDARNARLSKNVNNLQSACIELEEKILQLQNNDNKLTCRCIELEEEILKLKKEKCTLEKKVVRYMSDYGVLKKRLLTIAGIAK